MIQTKHSVDEQPTIAESETAILETKDTDGGQPASAKKKSSSPKPKKTHDEIRVGLEEDLAGIDEDLANIDEKLAWYQNRKKMKMQKYKETNKKLNEEKDRQRTARLCFRHGFLEKEMPDLVTLSDEQFVTFVKKGINTSYGIKILAEIVAKAKTEAVAENAKSATATAKSPAAQNANSIGAAQTTAAVENSNAKTATTTATTPTAGISKPLEASGTSGGEEPTDAGCVGA